MIKVNVYCEKQTFSIGFCQVERVISSEDEVRD